MATEGVLTRRLQSDPLLDGFRTIVLDEFHERSLHADLALAFARQAWRARSDLRLLVMSATLDAGPVARFLGDCPVIEVAGRPHPIDVRYEPRASLVDAVRGVLARSGGHLLCFLPGAPEIRRAQGDLGGAPGARVLPLHGTLSGEEQDAALAASAERKVILATNVAETSLTVEGVTDVIDTGQHKVLRYDASRGLDRLELERISADSAEQRAGRAGRTGPGRVLRLWDERDVLRPRREPEIERVDLAVAGPRRAGVGRRSAVLRLVRGAASGGSRRCNHAAGATRRLQGRPADSGRGRDAPPAGPSAACARPALGGRRPASRGRMRGPGRGLAAPAERRLADDRLRRAVGGGSDS